MATWQLRRFTNPAVLATIRPRHLQRFLGPYRDYLAGRGVPWPDRPDDPFDLATLIAVFATPTEATPDDLTTALYLVDESATPDVMDALLAAAQRLGLGLDAAEQSPADVALQFWFADRAQLERRHAEAHAFRARSFTSFRSARPAGPRPGAGPGEYLPRLERRLDDWFEAHNRGRGCRVFTLDRDGERWFVVRHGEPFRREESLRDAGPATVSYRPLAYDAVVLSGDETELRVHAGSDGARRLYRDAWGGELFGDEDAFAGTAKYTLAPLRDLGAAALAAADVPGIDWVKLREVQVLLPGEDWEVRVHRAQDLYRLWGLRGQGFPADGRLVEAAFDVRFAAAARPRRVVVRPPNVARFLRDEDAGPCEAWLAARGFALRPTDEPDGPGGSGGRR